MDSFTHGLFPFLAGKFFRRSKAECTALLLGGLAPDFDVFLMWIPLFFDTTLPFNHRGITHTIIFGFVTAAIVLFLASRKYFQNLIKHAFSTDIALSMTPRTLVFVYAGLLSHLFLDSLTAYGLALLYPFTLQRYSAEIFFYIDQYLLAISLVLTGYMVYLKRKINLPRPEISRRMQRTYVKMFCVLATAIILLVGLRYYEKSIAAEHFNLPTGSAYPSFSPFTWNVYDAANKTVYVFDTLNKSIISEYAFSGTNPGRFRH